VKKLKLELSLVGFFIGFLIGFSGMGGGALMAPILLFLGIHPSVVVGADLLYSSITKFVGGFYHWVHGNVNFKIAKFLLLGSIPFSMVGVIFHQFLNVSFGENLLRQIIGSTLILVALFLFLKTFFWKKSPCDTWLMKVKSCEKKVLFSIGAVVGFLVGLTSVGSGTLILSGLLLLYPELSLVQLVGTDIIHAFFMVSLASLAHFAVGNIDFSIVGYILLGSIPGVIFGGKVVNKLSERVISFALASILLFSGAKLL
jgi:hypothetical protein